MLGDAAGRGSSTTLHAEYMQNSEMEYKYNVFCSRLEYDGIQLYSTLLGATWHIALDSKRQRHTTKVCGDICRGAGEALADIHRAFDDWEQQVIGQFHEEIEWLGEHRHRSVGGKCANTEIHRLFGIFGAGLLKPGRGVLYSRSAFSNGIRNTCINGIHCIHVLCI